MTKEETLAPTKRMTLRDLEVGEREEYFDLREKENGFNDAVLFLASEACGVATVTLEDMDAEDCELVKADFLREQFAAMIRGATTGVWPVERHDRHAHYTPNGREQVKLRSLLGRDTHRMGDAVTVVSRYIRLISRVSGVSERDIRDWDAQEFFVLTAALPDFLPAPPTSRMVSG